jgi:hypothetical protein
MMPRVRRRSRSLVIAAGALVAVGIGVLVVTNRGDDGSAPPAPVITRAGSVFVRREAGSTAPMGPPPSTYHAVYATTDTGAGGLVRTTEEDWVRRPFEGRREIRTGGTNGNAKVTQTVVWGFARFQVQNGPEAKPQTLQTAPGPAGNDLRPDAVLDDATKAGTFEAREQRQVGRVRCQVYRTPQGAVAGPLKPSEAVTGRFSDLCFDEHGILVEEVGYEAGKIVHRKLLRSLEVDQPIADDRFAVTGTNLTLQQGGGSVRQLEPTSRPPGDTFYELDGPPEGFTLQGRYAVVPPQPQALNDPSRTDTRAGVVDVYVSGPDFLLVERGGTLGGADPFGPDPTAEKVDLAPIGDGELLLGMTGSEVRALTGGGHFVRIAGTAPPSDLVALARRLTPQPGGELRFLDGQ